MRKHKRRFEDYEEIALNLRTAKQLLYRAEVIFHRAPYADAMITIHKKLDRIISKTEDEMFADYPEQANTSVFYGGDGYRLNIKQNQEYILSSFGCSTCEFADAFAILTRDGSVLLSNDARVTFREDAKLMELVKNMMRRKEENDENLLTRPEWND